ncbi:MAG TPA: L,D-transpeptidase family protein [Flavipsychrobacter sp.]|nr:L,D-transpeptidase family protein [Flavipsychrobacter sp.]
MAVSKRIAVIQSVFFAGILLSGILISNDETVKPLPANCKVDSIVVIKHERTLCVFQNKMLLKTYRIALGRQPIGHKQYEGDKRTPEGLYHINAKNANSGYHKNLGISYPSNRDRLAAKRLGKSPGGDVKIHGLPNGQGYIGKAHLLKDWTYGCIAVTDEEVDELYKHVDVGTPINILP